MALVAGGTSTRRAAPKGRGGTPSNLTLSARITVTAGPRRHIGRCGNVSDSNPRAMDKRVRQNRWERFWTARSAGPEGPAARTAAAIPPSPRLLTHRYPLIAVLRPSDVRPREGGIAPAGVPRMQDGFQ